MVVRFDFLLNFISRLTFRFAICLIIFLDFKFLHILVPIFHISIFIAKVTFHISIFFALAQRIMLVFIFYFPLAAVSADLGSFC